jgi:hypothetical protein
VGCLLAQPTPLFSWAASAADPSGLEAQPERGARPHGGAVGDSAAPAMPTVRGAGEGARRTEVQGVDYRGRCGRRLTGRSRPWRHDSGGGGTAVMGWTVGGGSQRGGRRAT